MMTQKKRDFQGKICTGAAKEKEAARRWQLLSR
jgi:hypothetical protein